MAAAKIDPRFKYETYERNIFATREELTALAQIILDTDASWFKIIVNAIRIAAILWLFKIRQSMFEEEMMLGRQIYERRQDRDAEDDLEDDDLDTK